MHKHSDRADTYHFELFDFVVVGSDIIPERDNVRIAFASLWMLVNAVSAIIAGLGFQLNGSATYKFCRVGVAS